MNNAMQSIRKNMQVPLPGHPHFFAEQCNKKQQKLQRKVQHVRNYGPIAPKTRVRNGEYATKSNKKCNKKQQKVEIGTPCMQQKMPVYISTIYRAFCCRVQDNKKCFVASGGKTPGIGSAGGPGIGSAGGPGIGSAVGGVSE